MIDYKDNVTGVKYNNNDILMVEVDPFNTSYMVPNWEKNPSDPRGKKLYPPKLVKAKKVIEIIGRSVQDIVLDIEPEPEVWAQVVKQHEREKKIAKTVLENNKDVKSEKEVENGLEAWAITNSAARSFFVAEGRGRLPLKSVKVLENKGPRANDFESQVKDDRDFRKVEMEHKRLEILKMKAELEDREKNALAKKEGGTRKKSSTTSK